MIKKKVIVVFSGYNNRAVISFLRTLKKNIIRFVIVARDENDPVFNTSFCDNVILTRESQKLNINLVTEYIELIKKTLNVTELFIAPSTEALNRFILKERVALQKLNVTIPLVSEELYEAVSDKKLFCDICREKELLVPKEFDGINDAAFPFVAKPRKYFTPDGSVYAPFLIFDNVQKIDFIKKCNPDDFYFQEYVEGESMYLLYYFHRDSEIYKFSQENFVQMPEGGSMVAAKSSSFHLSDESKKYEKLFEQLEFYGLVMVELKVDGNKKYMIEANPRFWGPSQLFIDAKNNFFEAFLNDWGFDVNVPVFTEPESIEYFWFGGVLKAMKDNKALSFHKGDEKSFLMELEKWLQYDVYKREDTIGVFREEFL